MDKSMTIKGEAHWAGKDGDVKLFLREKCIGAPAKTQGTILILHGSSMAGTPTFDLQVPGRPDSSATDRFAKLGFDCWCADMEGYGRSTKDRDDDVPIAQGADDCYAAALHKTAGKRPLMWHFLGRTAREHARVELNKAKATDEQTSYSTRDERLAPDIVGWGPILGQQEHQSDR